MVFDLFDDDDSGLGDAGLGELGNLNKFYKGNASAETKAAKAKGGFGTNKLDDSARDFSRKQIAVEGELFDRLSDVHEKRSPRAQRMDEQRKAPVTDDPEQWADDPSHWDWPGIDTPRR